MEAVLKWSTSLHDSTGSNIQKPRIGTSVCETNFLKVSFQCGCDDVTTPNMCTQMSLPHYSNRIDNNERN